MMRTAVRFHALALGTAALISLVALASEATAKPEIRHSRSPAIAIHRSATPPARAFHETALHGGHRLVSARTYVGSRRYAFGHGYGHRSRGYNYGGAAAAGVIVGESYGYPSYSGGSYSEGYGYGYLRHHSCRWYAYHEPYNTPYRCRGSYGYTYGYVSPSYGYGYEYRRSYSYHAGGAWRGSYHRHYAVTGGSRQPTHLVAARVHVHGASHFVSRGGPRFVAQGGTHIVARSGPHLAGGGVHIRRHGP
jgi:hypothetical protein